MKRILAVLTLALVVAWVAGCGESDRPLRQDEVQLTTQVLLQDEAQSAVRVDSVSWQLGTLNFTIPEAVEIEGVFEIRFENITSNPIAVRYELRFLDEDGFLIDLEFPRGQPVDLEVHQLLDIGGSFFINLGDVEDLRLVTTMEVVVKLESAQE